MRPSPHPRPDRRVSYSRTIRVTDRLAKRIAEGEGVIVVHGIDLRSSRASLRGEVYGAPGLSGAP
jgi:hypothetical protein